MLEGWYELHGDRGRENHVELEDEPSLLEGVLVLRQTLAHDALDVLVLDDLAGYRRYDQIAAVEGLDDLLESAQRLDQLQVHHHGEVGAVAELENWMLFHVKDDDDVAGLEVWLLVTLAWN